MKICTGSCVPSRRTASCCHTPSCWTGEMRNVGCGRNDGRNLRGTETKMLEDGGRIAHSFNDTICACIPRRLFASSCWHRCVDAASVGAVELLVCDWRRLYYYACIERKPKSGHVQESTQRHKRSLLFQIHCRGCIDFRRCLCRVPMTRSIPHRGC